MKKRIIILLTITIYILKIIFNIYCFYYCFHLIFPKKDESDIIINSYYKYEENFENVVNELQSDLDTVYIIKYPICYSISINYNDEKYICSKNNKYYKKYIDAFELINDLKLEGIYKDEYNNISFTFNSMIGYGQCIIYMMNEQKYISSGFEIINKEKIKENWFYIEEE